MLHVFVHHEHREHGILSNCGMYAAQRSYLLIRRSWPVPCGYVAVEVKTGSQQVFVSDYEVGAAIACVRMALPHPIVYPIL